MSDLISRQAAIRIAEQGQVQGYEWQFKKLCELPSVQPRKGKWIDGMCSECEESTQDFLTNFCPNCGCCMEEGDA